MGVGADLLRVFLKVVFNLVCEFLLEDAMTGLEERKRGLGEKSNDLADAGGEGGLSTPLISDLAIAVATSGIDEGTTDRRDKRDTEGHERVFGRKLQLHDEVSAFVERTARASQQEAIG